MTGETIGNYRVCELAGEGGMGRVYRAIDMALEREVALKALHPDLARQPEVVERFRSEAVTLARLSHVNIAGVYNLLQYDGACFIVMEFLRGRTLDQCMRESGAMTPAAALPIFVQILEGLDFAHRGGVLHRDIKPANIFIQDGGVVKLTDFGIARIAGRSRQTRTGHVVGTLEYMSPERIRAEREDGRSDLYAAAVVLYEMLAGAPPFKHESEYDLMRAQIEEAPRSLSMVKPGLSPHLQTAIERALAKRPDDRFSSAREFRAALEGVGAVSSGPVVSAASAKDVFIPAAAPVPGAPSSSRSSTSMAFRAMVAAAFGLIGLVAWFLFGGGGTAPVTPAASRPPVPPVTVPVAPPAQPPPLHAAPPPVQAAKPAPTPAPASVPPSVRRPPAPAAPKLADDVKKGLDDILSQK